MATTYSYSDLDLYFIEHPITGDINKLKDEDAIKASIRNLLLTMKGELPFQPEIGSSVRALLFENRSPLVDAALAESIKEVITNYEPRVILNSVTVDFDDANDGYNVTIDFTIRPLRTTVATTIFLGR